MSEEQGLRKFKFWLFVPAMVVPILTVFFWLMGGGSIVAIAGNQKRGLNMQLPSARAPQDSVADKLSFYDAAAGDSTKRIEQLKMDPYRKEASSTMEHNQVEYDYTPVSAKIASIQKRVAEVRVEEPDYTQAQQPLKAVASASSPDPEMEAINNTLDKLMAIQNPHQVQAKALVSNSGTYSVSPVAGDGESYLGRVKVSKGSKGFYNEPSDAYQANSSIIAIIPSEQILQSGSLVKIELRSAITINSVTVTAGSNVFGIASLEGERLIIRIPTIRFHEKILAVSLAVYDLDGLEGIYIPGAVARDVAKTSADNAIQSAGATGFDVSLKAQAVTAGIGAAKSLLSKKVRQVRVTINAGYQVLLVDTKQKQ